MDDPIEVGIKYTLKFKKVQIKAPIIGGFEAMKKLKLIR